MPTSRAPKLFTFRSGGWVLALAVVLTLVGSLKALRPLLDERRLRPRGDGRNAESYGFDLSSPSVPIDKIVVSGMVVDALPPLTDPSSIAPGDAPARYLVSADKVVGIVLGGEARAYPLRVLVWHEIVNDTVGGVPIAVTYHPLSESIAVFDRRVSGRTLAFGFSGLLYQSSLLMYDRRETRGHESLWSQLQARAITGEDARARSALTLIPFAVVRYDDWRRDHPDTRVLAPVPGEEAKYGQDVYASYLNSPELRFPVDPLPPPGSLEAKTRVLVTGSPGRWSVTPVDVDRQAGRFEIVSPSGSQPVAGFYAFWFAWYATHPEDAGTIAAR